MPKKELDVYNGSGDDQPTTCPHCGARSEYVTLSPASEMRQLHTCLNRRCRYKFVVEFRDGFGAYKIYQAKPKKNPPASVGAITKEQVDVAKRRIFNVQYANEAPDSDTIGILVSQYLQWDGGAIIRAFSSALEDANFHKENSQIQKVFKWAFE